MIKENTGELKIVSEQKLKKLEEKFKGIMVFNLPNNDNLLKLMFKRF